MQRFLEKLASLKSAQNRRNSKANNHRARPRLEALDPREQPGSALTWAPDTLLLGPNLAPLDFDPVAVESALTAEISGFPPYSFLPTPEAEQSNTDLFFVNTPILVDTGAYDTDAGEVSILSGSLIYVPLPSYGGDPSVEVGILVEDGAYVADVAYIASPCTSATLTQAQIWFFTNDDDKDYDTRLTVTVRQANGAVAAELVGTFGRFPDDSIRGPFGFQFYQNPRPTLLALQGGSVTIRIDPVGNDTWRFNFRLDLAFSEGQTFAYRVNGVQLSQSSRERTFGLPSF